MFSFSQKTVKNDRKLKDYFQAPQKKGAGTLVMFQFYAKFLSWVLGALLI
jgi:hypothetical protein